MQRPASTWGRVTDHGDEALRRVAWLAVLLLVLGSGCATPIGVHRVDSREVYRVNSESVLSSERPSVVSRQVLLRMGLFERFEEDPVGVLQDLHERTLAEMTQDQLFALAEYSELHAERSDDTAYHVAAALYAYAFLFPDDQPPLAAPLDPRTRTAAALYNRAVSNALTGTGEKASLDRLLLPPHVGRLELSFDRAQLQWADRRLSDFVPATNLEIRGLRNRYRRPGIGAAFASLPVVEPGVELQPKDLLIVSRMRVPVSALLRFDAPRAGLHSGVQTTSLRVYNSREQDSTQIAGREVPIEYETSVALALSLEGAPIWDTEIAGFRNPTAVPENGQLAIWGPHRPGRMPVVFVHGTASSVARWAEMINELDSDPEIRKHYEFWFFTYPTGGPILFSAKLLRSWLNRVVATLDPDSTDESLRRMVLIGHSQGGLLCRLQVIESGSYFWKNISDTPFDQAKLDPETRSLLHEALFFDPAPFVSRVIFISTPQRGALMAGSWPGRLANRLTTAPARLVNLPLEIAKAGVALPGMAVDLVQGDTDELRVKRAMNRLPTSVDNMSPSSAFVHTLGEIPISPRVIAHSIIPVRGGEPPDGQNDGVVAFDSASIDGVDSQLVVFHSGHSVQSNPLAIQEVRRILLEQMGQKP